MAKTDKADKPEKTKTRTIIDVTHADKTLPSPNSKSVIVPSRPLLKDPMVVEKTDKTLENSVTEPLSSDKPAKAPSIAELAEAAAKDNAKADKKDLEPTPQAETEPSNEEADKTDGKTDKPEAAEEPVTDSAPDSKPSPEAVEAKEAELTKHDAAIEKLVVNKQYYLPINTVENRRSKRFVALGVLLSLVLIAAWADIALDAGLIQINGVKPLTHFFSN